MEMDASTDLRCDRSAVGGFQRKDVGSVLQAEVQNDSRRKCGDYRKSVRIERIFDIEHATLSQGVRRSD